MMLIQPGKPHTSHLQNVLQATPASSAPFGSEPHDGVKDKDSLAAILNVDMYSESMMCEPMTERKILPPHKTNYYDQK